MGSFSYICGACSLPIAGNQNDWMNRVTVYSQDRGRFIAGAYDGYGSINNVDTADLGTFHAWHTACKNIMIGQPGWGPPFSGLRHDRHQGADNYRLKEPKTVKDILNLRQIAWSLEEYRDPAESRPAETSDARLFYTSGLSQAMSIDEIVYAANLGYISFDLL